MSSAAEGRPLLEVEGLRTYFPVKKGFLRRQVGWIKAVDGVSLTINQGETVSLVGESGCGKSTTARSLVRAVEPTDGRVAYTTRAGVTINVREATPEQLREVRREVRMVFQDPFQSLNPRQTILDIVGEPLRNYRVADGQALRERVGQLLVSVGLDARHMGRYPHAFSGGQRQRVALARALLKDAPIVLLDEPAASLDPEAEALVTADLLGELSERTVIISAHRPETIAHVEDVVVLEDGRVSDRGLPVVVAARNDYFAKHFARSFLPTSPRHS